MSVRKVRVGDVLELQRRKVDVSFEGSYREIGLRSFGRGVFHKDAVSGEEIAGKKVYWIEPGDLLISNVFAWEGAVAVASPDDVGRIGSHRFMTWTGSPKDVSADYLRHYFVSEPGLTQLRRASPGSAGRNRTLGIGAFEALVIPLPNLDEQRRIAARLDGLTHVVGEIRRQDSLQDRRRAGLARQLLDNSWTPKPAGDILALDRTPITVDPDSTYSPIGVRSFGRGLIRYSESPAAELSKLRYFTVTPDRLVISNIKAWEGAIALSASGDETRVASNRFLMYEARVDNELDLRFVRDYLLSPQGIAQLDRASPGSADRNRTLSMANFERVSIPVPPIGEQRNISTSMDKLRFVEAQEARRAHIADALGVSARNEEFARLS